MVKKNILDKKIKSDEELASVETSEKILPSEEPSEEKPEESKPEETKSNNYKPSIPEPNGWSNKKKIIVCLVGIMVVSAALILTLI